MFLKNGETYWYKQPDIWKLLDIYLNPCKSRIRQKWTITGNESQRVTKEQNGIGLRNKDLYNPSSSSHRPRSDDKQQQKISKYITTTSVGNCYKFIVSQNVLKTFKMNELIKYKRCWSCMQIKHICSVLNSLFWG